MTSNFIKIQPVILGMKHVEGRTDGWTNQQTLLSLCAFFSCTLGNQHRISNKNYKSPFVHIPYIINLMKTLKKKSYAR
jgi:hypothetical protein